MTNIFFASEILLDPNFFLTNSFFDLYIQEIIFKVFKQKFGPREAIKKYYKILNIVQKGGVSGKAKPFIEKRPEHQKTLVPKSVESKKILGQKKFGPNKFWSKN